ncbi:MAG TPA: hypothetical protein DEQ02_07225 [Ruminococcaceae bacterium]|nr:hypothetical protein [Oscillospiraceae bacterium]
MKKLISTLLVIVVIISTVLPTSASNAFAQQNTTKLSYTSPYEFNNNSAQSFAVDSTIVSKMSQYLSSPQIANSYKTALALGTEKIILTEADLINWSIDSMSDSQQRQELLDAFSGKIIRAEISQDGAVHVYTDGNTESNISASSLKARAFSKTYTDTDTAMYSNPSFAYRGIFTLTATFEYGQKSNGNYYIKPTKHNIKQTFKGDRVYGVLPSKYYKIGQTYGTQEDVSKTLPLSARVTGKVTVTHLGTKTYDLSVYGDFQS